MTMHRSASPLLLALVLLGCGQPDMLAAEAQEGPSGDAAGSAKVAAPQFVLSTDPEEAILSLTFGGSPTGMRIRYVLFGDQRLVRETTDMGGNRIGTRETRVSPERAHELVGIVVSRGVMISAAERVSKELTRRGPAEVLDAGYATLEVHLESLHQDGKATQRPSATLTVEALLARARSAPDIPEVQGMALLYDALAKEVGR